jgi:Fe-S cluster assembly scaffold protein SufB
MGRYAFMSELEELMKAYGESGGDKGILANNEIAHLVASGHKILSARGIEGLEVKAKETLTGITEGNAAGARGHVDCMEILKDKAVAQAIPIVKVTNPLAKVTHEAAIGSVDKKQMETLMAHGLTPDEAVEMIVKGILR